MHGTIRFCMSIPMEGTSKKRGRKQRPSPKRILHFLLQNLRDEFAHPLPQPLLQTLPPGIPLLLVRARCRATVRHGVSSCGRDLQQRDPGFVFNDFSGAYAFHFSTGIGTEPTPVGTFKEGNKSIPIVARLRPQDRAQLSQIKSLYVYSSQQNTRSYLINHTKARWRL